MNTLQTQIKNFKEYINKNENVKFSKKKDKEELNNYLINEMFKEDVEDKPITLQDALNFEIDYNNKKNKTNTSIHKSPKNKSTEL